VATTPWAVAAGQLVLTQYQSQADPVAVGGAQLGAHAAVAIGYGRAQAGQA